MSALLRRGGFSLLLGLLGCSTNDRATDGGTRPVFPYVESVPAQGCEVPDACDVLATDCQETWLATLTCLRGMDPMLVPIRVIDEETFTSELAALPVEPRPTPDHWERALVYLGFVQPGAYELSNTGAVDYIAAYYSHETHDITVIDHGAPADGIFENSVLLHELVHAAQDQEVGLQAFFDEYATTSDAECGVRGLIEGEATFYDTLVLGALNGIDVGSIDLRATLEERRKHMLDAALAAPSPFFMASYTLPYGLGAPYAGEAYRAAGADGIRELYADPPLSSRRLLLLDVAADMELPEPEFLDVAALADAPFTHLETDSFGALGLWLYGGSQLLPLTLELSAKLRGDRFDVLSSGAETALVWQLAFDDRASATTFRNLAHTEPYGAADWYEGGGGEVVLVVGTDPVVQADLSAALGL